MKNIFTQFFNYCFPPNEYEGKKITDEKWFRKATIFAIYPLIILPLLVVIWGIMSPNPTKFFLKPQFIVILGILFWTATIVFVVKALRKRHRDPAFLLPISAFIVVFITVRGLFGLLVFTVASSMIQDARVHLDSKKQAISHDVREKIATRKSKFDDLSVATRIRSQEIQNNVSKAFSELDDRMESRFDRFRRIEKENSDAFWNIVLANREKNKNIDKAFWKSCQKTQDKVTQWKREWCRTHTLSQMCNHLPPEEIEPAQTTEAKIDENIAYIDLPLNFNYEIRE